MSLLLLHIDAIAFADSMWMFFFSFCFEYEYKTNFFLIYPFFPVGSMMMTCCRDFKSVDFFKNVFPFFFICLFYFLVTLLTVRSFVRMLVHILRPLKLKVLHFFKKAPTTSLPHTYEYHIKVHACMYVWMSVCVCLLSVAVVNNNIDVYVFNVCNRFSHFTLQHFFNRGKIIKYLLQHYANLCCICTYISIYFLLMVVWAGCF